MRRRDHGEQLRRAMREAGLSIPGLAKATREADPRGRGVSQALIGFLVCTDGTSARETCGDPSAVLISTTLKKPTNVLFIDETVLGAPTSSTSTGESRNDHYDAGP